MQSPAFSATVERDGIDAVVRVVGDVDIDTGGRLWTAIEQAFGNGAANIVLDLTDTTFMDSSGLRIIIRASSRFGAEAIRLRNPNRQIQKVLEITGLRKVVNLDLVEAEEAATAPA